MIPSQNNIWKYHTKGHEQVFGFQLVSYEKTTLEHTFGCMKKRRRRVDLKSCMTLASYLAWVVLQIQNNTIKLAEQPMWTQNYFVLCKKWVPLTHFERLFLFLNDSEPLFVDRKNRIPFGVAAKFYFCTWMTQNVLLLLAPTEKFHPDLIDWH